MNPLAENPKLNMRMFSDEVWKGRIDIKITTALFKRTVSKPFGIMDIGLFKLSSCTFDIFLHENELFHSREFLGISWS